MKKITNWICEQCGRSFNTSEECEKHELSHKLTPRTYEGVLRYKTIDDYGEVQYIGDSILNDVLSCFLGYPIRICLMEDVGGEKSKSEVNEPRIKTCKVHAVPNKSKETQD